MGVTISRQGQGWVIMAHNLIELGLLGDVPTADIGAFLRDMKLILQGYMQFYLLYLLNNQGFKNIAHVRKYLEKTNIFQYIGALLTDMKNINIQIDKVK